MRTVVVAAALLLPMFSSSNHTFPPARTEYKTPDAEYPLQLRVLYAARSYHFHNDDLDGVKQTGIANLLTDPKLGLKYTSTCEDGFLHSQPDDFYEARWKKPNAKLEILTVDQNVKPGKVAKPKICELDVVVQPKPYTKEVLKPQDDQGFS